MRDMAGHSVRQHTADLLVYYLQSNEISQSTTSDTTNEFNEQNKQSFMTKCTLN